MLASIPNEGGFVAREPALLQKRTTKGVKSMGRISAFIQDESGATAIEYGLLAVLISVAAIVAMSAVGTSLSNTFSTVANSL